MAKATGKKRQTNSRKKPVNNSSRNNARRPAAKKVVSEQLRHTDKAYRRAKVQRNVKSRKRRGNRGGNYIMYYILAGIVIITVLIILSNTVLFNVSSINVEGNARYAPEQIIAVSGLNIGENLLYTDTQAAEKRILDSLSCLDGVTVKKQFPTKLEITVEESQKWYQVSQYGKTAAISRQGRIVELSYDAKLPTVVGYDPVSMTEGDWLSSGESGKTQIPALIFEAAEKCGLEGILTIDISDRFDIIITCTDNVTLEIGGISDIESKLTTAISAIKLEHPGIILDLRQQDKVYVRDKVEQQTLPELDNTREASAEAPLPQE